jgi:LacI family transcriptional regulator
VGNHQEQILDFRLDLWYIKNRYRYRERYRERYQRIGQVPIYPQDLQMSNSTQERPSIRDVACQAGVSVSTVSRVLNARPDVAPATRERILKAIAELNYHPNAQAVGLSRRRTGVVGLVVSDMITPFCTSIIQSVQNSLRERGYWMLLAAHRLLYEQDVHLQARLVEELGRSRRIDGLLVLTPMESSLEILRVMAREELPSVLIDMQYDGSELNYIAVDNYQGGYLATEYLLQLGYRDIAILCGPDWMRVSHDRLAGYKAALQDWRVPICPEWIVSGEGFNEGAGRRAMHTLLETGHQPRAIFASDDLIAFGAMAVLDEEGAELRVPEDIAFVGYDDIPAAASFRPPLTTVHQPLDCMGQLAVEHLCHLIAGETDELLQVTMGTELVVRASCGADGSPQVAMALSDSTERALTL